MRLLEEMSEGGPSDNEDVEQEVNIQETLEDCLERLDRIEEEMFIKFSEPRIVVQSAEQQTLQQKEEVKRAAIWARHNIKELWCIYEIRPLLEKLASEERDGRPWFEWLRWVLWST